ncbi:hypothetical protein BH09BAC6_BH09BAC6_33710 [soil metagenome]|jgi:hypothetical protein
MDIPREHPEKLRLFKEFELPDLIPYALTLFMLMGYVYLLMHAADFKLGI